MQYHKIFEQLDAQCRKHDYAGWDPFDGLNSKLFQATPLAKSRWLRLAWLQFFKRSPVNYRSLALVPRTHNAKALSLFVRSYLAAGDHDSAKYCLDKMLSLRSDAGEWGEAAWGYPFDWQAKAFFVSKGEPNVICTLYAVLALEEAERARVIDDASLFIHAAAEFVMKRLLRKNEEYGTYVAYIPGADAFVHNASLWGAYILTAAYHRGGDEALRETVLKVVEATLSMQGEQGEWRYGTLPHHQFIDGFHTGYNLEALYRMNQILKAPEIDQSIEKGMAYYEQNFFDEQGRAAYYHDNPYPLDPHSAAQAVLTFSLIQPKKSKVLCERIIQSVCSEMWSSRGQHFHYQHTKHYQNRCNYLRWTQAWMHLALQRYLAIIT